MSKHDSVSIRRLKGIPSGEFTGSPFGSDSAEFYGDRMEFLVVMSQAVPVSADAPKLCSTAAKITAGQT